MYSSRILSMLLDIKNIIQKGYGEFRRDTLFTKVYPEFILPYIEPKLKQKFESIDFESLYNDIIIDHDHFVKSSTVDRMLLLQIFEKLAKVFCLDDEFESRYLFDNRVHTVNLYPLSTVTGIFGLNSFLYAYFNNLFLVGFPLSLSQYDTLYGCSFNPYGKMNILQMFISLKFAQHDMNHYFGMLATKDSFDSNLLYHYYSHIVNSTNPVHEKEIVLFILFMIIHEYVPYYNNIAKDINIVRHIAINEFIAFIDDIYPRTLVDRDLVILWVEDNIPNDHSLVPILLDPKSSHDKYISIFLDFLRIIDGLVDSH